MIRRLFVPVLVLLWALASCGRAPVVQGEPTPPSVVLERTPSLAPSPTATTTRPAPAPSASPTASASATRTSQPSAPPSPVPSVTASPSPAPTPVITVETGARWTSFGASVEGRPLESVRVGDGPFKVVLVGDIHGHFERNTYTLTLELADHFLSHPAEVAPDVSLWLIPTLNPDGLAGGTRFNAHQVDLNRNADTDADGCGHNDWRPDTHTSSGEHEGAGGPYPFSEPELQALQAFLDDAHVAIFYHSAAGAIFPGGCLANEPSLELTHVLAEATSYEVPEGGWLGYPVTGGIADYLASEGVAAAEVELTNHADLELDRNLAGVRAVLAQIDRIMAADAPTAEHVRLDAAALDEYQYDSGAFVHALAMEVLSDTLYMVDGGRVLGVALGGTEPARDLLAPGNAVLPGEVALPVGASTLPVLEPLALAETEGRLLVLDRAGDVYRLEPDAAQWSVERFDRAERDTYDHYFVALAASGEARFLMETTHEDVWRFVATDQNAAPSAERLRGEAWAELPTGRDVDLAAAGDTVWALVRDIDNPQGRVLRFDGGRRDADFAPQIEFIHPLQIRVAPTGGLWVLDRLGRRLVELDSRTGQVQRVFEFASRQVVSAFWVGESQVLLAGRDRLYVYPGHGAVQRVRGGDALTAKRLPHDPAVLLQLRGLAVPIAGARPTTRDFQMPGAPRHYRLGVHEGMDWYSQTVGVRVSRSTAVRAVADGVVIRADHDYVSPTAAEMDAWLTESRELGLTPKTALDGLRGRQVWVEHANGLVSRYVHLGAIDPSIGLGTAVVKGQVLAQVGNSGTPASLQGSEGDVHLHLELWLQDTEGGLAYHLGQFLRPIETRLWLEWILR
jgi:murein DD-endopeptidase MepM/ murein hydrolase activator NlpD